MATSLHSNIWKYTLVLISHKRIFVAILGAYYLTIPDVNAWWVGVIMSVGSIAGFCLEIPSGYVSDKIGHKKALVLARICMLLSTVFFLIGGSIPVLILGMVFLSISGAFHSGTGDAFMHETLRGLGKEKEYTRIMGKISSIGFAVPIIFMVLIPFLVSFGYHIPFVISLVVDVIGLGAALLLVKPPISPEHIQEIGVTNFRQVMREGYRLQFFRYALFAGIVSGVLIAVGTFRAPYQAVLGVPVIWFGVFFGMGRVFASLMLAYSGKLRAMGQNVHSFFLSQAILYLILISMLAVIENKWVVVAVFLVINAFQWGLHQLSNSYLLEIIGGSKFKATLLSVRAQISEAVTAICSVGLGFAIQRSSYAFGFLCLGAAWIVVFVPLYVYIKKSTLRG